MIREGYIEKLIYNGETGYSVFVVETTEGEEVFVGTAAGLAEGLYISAEGEYVHHPQYDIQFKFISYEIMMPDDIVSVERFLGSGIVKGIGEILAKRIVKKFKLDTLRIMEEEPERLAEVKGISLEKARKIAISYEESRQYREVIMYLSKYGVTSALAMKIFAEYGNEVYTVIEKNPYQIAEDIPGVGFKTADDIALMAGVDLDSEFRVRSAIIYVLNQSMGEGHMYLPEKMLMAKTYSILETNEDADIFYEKVHDILFEMSMERKVILKERELDLTEEEKERMLEEQDVPETTEIAVYAKWNYYCELNSARMLLDLRMNCEVNEETLEEAICQVEENSQLELDDEQKEAVRTAVSSGVSVITGGPGTGKTTITNAIIKYFNLRNEEVLLAAPTGRAAKRITESTGYKAKTIHRLLEFSGIPSEDGEVRSRMQFLRNEENPLEAETIIIDEASMVDSQLFYALMQAIVHGTRLIMVGDIDQLPSVGAGNVLHDIIESGCFPVVTLKHIFRQVATSRIIENAHKICNGEHLEIANDKKGDFFFIPKQSPADITREIRELVLENLPKFLRIQPEEIQVLSPTRKYELGVETLNKYLQGAMNPADPGKREKERNGIIFREGDKVMQIKNNYKLEWKIPPSVENNYITEEGIGVFNGDMGKITLINDFDEEITVRFDDGRVAQYTFAQADELEHAFAVTIHKSQGTEYTAVIIPIYRGSSRLFNRNLLYTGVTRAKRMVILVGNLGIVNEMIDNISEKKRYTSFSERLKEMAFGFD